ncbi:acyl-CoA carboxylase subunit epsilon [Micromonospora sp. CPCC 205558]|uniref:acyl-CoA carboxylase subunit epsilon n=1 Tax=Micromonospora sp. CPCC 205558 TaxID=3122403 RepID=UPI002FEF3019
MSAEEPLFRVVRGVPTAEELAALVGAIIIRSRPTTTPAPAAASAWVRSGRPGNSRGWRAAGLPR